MPKEPAKDRRVRRSINLLQQAIIDLLKEKPLSQIQIKEITNRADVSRQTFYLHFESKEDLLFSYIDDVIAQIYTRVFDNAVGQQFSLELLIKETFNAWGSYAEPLRWVMQVDNKDLLIDRLRLHVAKLMDTYDSLPQTTLSITPMHDYLIDFITGGVYMLLRRWQMENMGQSAQDLGDFAFQLIDSLPFHKSN